MHENVPVRFGRGRLDSLGNKGLAAYLIASGCSADREDGLQMNRPRLRFPQHQIIPSRRLDDRDLLPVDLAAKKRNRRCPEPQRLVNQPRAEAAGKLSNLLPEFSAGMKSASD